MLRLSFLSFLKMYIYLTIDLLIFFRWTEQTSRLRIKPLQSISVWIIRSLSAYFSMSLPFITFTGWNTQLWQLLHSNLTRLSQLSSTVWGQFVFLIDEAPEAKMFTLYEDHSDDLMRCDDLSDLGRELWLGPILNALTGNQHGGDKLRGLQEVHVPPLEGLTVVGLQVTEQRKQQDPLTDLDAWRCFRWFKSPLYEAICS